MYKLSIAVSLLFISAYSAYGMEDEPSDKPTFAALVNKCINEIEPQLSSEWNKVASPWEDWSWSESDSLDFGFSEDMQEKMASVWSLNRSVEKESARPKVLTPNIVKFPQKQVYVPKFGNILNHCMESTVKKIFLKENQAAKYFIEKKENIYRKEVFTGFDSSSESVECY